MSGEELGKDCHADIFSLYWQIFCKCIVRQVDTDMKPWTQQVHNSILAKTSPRIQRSVTFTTRDRERINKCNTGALVDIMLK